MAQNEYLDLVEFMNDKRFRQRVELERAYNYGPSYYFDAALYDSPPDAPQMVLPKNERVVCEYCSRVNTDINRGLCMGCNAPLGLSRRTNWM